MAEETLEARLRAAATDLLETRSEANAREFVGLAFPIVESSVSNTLGRFDLVGGSLDVTVDEAVLRFLDKLVEDRFLKHLIAAPSPAALLRTSVRNATVDLLRAPRARVQLAKAEVSERRRLEGEADDADDDEPSGVGEPEDDDDAVARRAERALGGLTDEQRAMLDAAVGRFDERDVAWVARARGISVDRARAEIGARSATVASERAALETELSARLERLARLHDKLRRVRALRGEREVVHRPRTDPAPVQLLWPRTPALLRKLDDESLRDLESGLLAQVKATNRLLAETQQALGKPLGTQPKWREIALLIGLVERDAPEPELLRAQNTVQQRVGRLLKRLAALAPAEDDPHE
jgi:hypothetical protein